MSDAKSPTEPSIDEILATIRRIITEDEQAGGSPSGPRVTASAAGDDRAAVTGGQTATAASGATEEKTGGADDILELTEALNEDGTTRHLAPIGGASSRRAASLTQTASSRPETQPQRSDAASPRPAPAAAGLAREQREPRLARDLPVGGGDRTLEDIVRDTLRPLLQAWLDENLQPLVTRLVQAEIERTRV